MIEKALMEITREIFEQQRRPRFGNANPERMQLAFWEWMIRGDENSTRERPSTDVAPVMRDGKLKSSYGPYRARDLFQVALNRDDGPIWTFDRMGATRNHLPDGRLICIGGEHEDFYDPDFCIYNDVIVFDGEKIEIYGYPKEVFPPTDFHSATLVGKQLIIIGSLGYKNERTFGVTPVYALDLSDFRIDRVDTSGDMPGWIHEHEAEIANGAIKIQGGKTVREYRGNQRIVRNFDVYVLDPNSWMWQQTTCSEWSQAKIWSEENKPFPLKPHSGAETLLPQTIPHTVVHCKRREAEILVDNAVVSIKIGVIDIEIIVQAPLPQKLLTQLLEEILMNAQLLFQCKCILQRL